MPDKHFFGSEAPQLKPAVLGPPKKNRFGGFVTLNEDRYSHLKVPQANSLAKIALIIEALLKAPVSVKDVARSMEMVERQAHYYVDALRFLEIATTVPYGGGEVVLLWLDDKVYRWFANGRVEKRLAQWIYERNLLERYETLLSSGSYSPVTFKRREESMRAWRNWIEERLAKKNDK